MANRRLAALAPSADVGERVGAPIGLAIQTKPEMEIGMTTFLPPCAVKRYSAAHLAALEHMLLYHKSTARWATDLAYEIAYLRRFYESVEQFFFTPITAPGIDPQPFMLASFMSPNAISDVVAAVADDISKRAYETRKLRTAPIADGLLNADAQLETIRQEFMKLCCTPIKN